MTNANTWLIHDINCGFGGFFLFTKATDNAIFFFYHRNIFIENNEVV